MDARLASLYDKVSDHTKLADFKLADFFRQSHCHPVPMPRLPRPWSKKRGSRLANRVFSGIIGEVLFFGVLILLGLFALTLGITSRFGQATTVPAGFGFWSLLVTGGVLLITGGGGLAYRILSVGASSERRAAFAKRTSGLEFAGRRDRPAAALPNVPSGTALNDSPGIHLTYRLPATGSPVIRVAAAALLALLWSGTWVVLVAVSAAGFWWQTPRPVLTFLLVPLGAISVWSVRYFFRHLREAAGVGATIVEISDNPLYPGNRYRLYVVQYGNLRLRRLRVMMVCEEESIFRQGTDVRTDKHLASELTICNEKNVSIDSKGAWEREFDMLVPLDAMHSFQSPHNAVHWKIIVAGESRPWPSFCRSFPVVVHPLRDRSNHDHR
ncbi:hypothetical protein SH139x_000413 [Planctomycetaceae bacterium SH139]